MDEKEFAHFQKELVRDPSKGPVSRGTGELAALMGGIRPPKRPPKAEEEVKENSR